MTLLAGFGRGVITPPVPVELAGFAESQPATEVHDDLEARALYVAGDGDDAAAACLVVCDLLGMSADFADPIRAAVGDALGLPPAAVLTASTHTHAGPSAMRGTRALGWVTPEGYRELLVAGCLDAARQAVAAAEPAGLHFVRADLPRELSLNRRGLPYAPWFSVVDARRPDGGRVGTLANVAIHPVALGPECLAVSTDWVGPFRAALEERAGGPAVLLSGALGDVNPVHVHRQGNECVANSFDEAQQLGREVAEAVDGVLGSAEPCGDRVEVVDRRLVPVPLTPSGLAPRAAPGDTMEVELVEWRLGSIPLVSIPGEAFHAFGRRVEDARGGRALLAGLSPVWQGYLPVPFGEGYEEGVSYGRPAVDAILDALVAGPSPKGVTPSA